MASKEVEVTIHRGSFSSPGVTHAVVSVGSKEQKTKSSSKALAVQWEEAFRFPVKDEASEAVRIVVYRQCRLFGHYEVGWCEVPLSDLPRGLSTFMPMKLIVGASTSDSELLEITCKANGFGRNPSAVGAVMPLVASLIPYLEQAAPLFGAIDAGVEVAAPLLGKAWAIGQMAWQTYNLEALVPAILGLAMVFLGGTYMTTIAAVEAFRLCGWNNTKRSMDLVHKELKRAHLVATQNDDDDALPVGAGATKLSRVVVALDPVALEEGVLGLHQGLLAVLATLRTRFAHAITLGASLASMGTRELTPILVPVLKSAMPEQYHKWAPFAVRYLIAAICCSLAWTLLRIFSAFHSATYGAHLMAEGIVKYLVKQKKITPARAEALNVTMIIWAVGCLGFLWQLSIGFQLPFPFNLLLFPLTIVEYLLTFIVNWDQSWI